VVVVVVAVATAAVNLFAPPARAERDPIEDRLAVVDKTETILVDKNTARAAELRARVRTLYKLSRAGWAPLWIDAGERSDLLRRRGAARRILVRDLTELEILREELAVVLAARSRLEGARATAASAATPERGSLTRPVPGAVASKFGRFKGSRSRAKLTNRGIKLATPAGRPVRATHAGTIEYAGPLRGLGEVVLIARDDGVRSVIGLVAELAVRTGDTVEAGDQVGVAAGRLVYLEVRIDVGPGGLPIDPAPLLAH
jgi:septal ring factor EnvC (AmiA/AmiB activator)